MLKVLAAASAPALSHCNRLSKLYLLFALHDAQSEGSDVLYGSLENIVIITLRSLPRTPHGNGMRPAEKSERLILNATLLHSCESRCA